MTTPRAPLLITALACAALLVACSSGGGTFAPGSPSGGTTSPSASATATPAPHTGVSQRESPELAAELVPVAGYSYHDVSSKELAGDLKLLGTDVLAASFHTVVSDDHHQEVAFLQLSVESPADAMHSSAYAQRVASSVLETSSPTRLTFNGQTVWFTERPTSSKSRYIYFWDRQGTFGWMDGPDRTTLTAFATDYFSAGFRGAEPALLSSRLVPVAGYSVTNAVDRGRELTLASAELPGATATLHYVFDSKHSIAGLVLAGPVAAGTSDVAAATAWLTKAYDLPAYNVKPQADLVIGGVAVHPLHDGTSGMTVYVWTWKDTGVTGWLLTSRPDLAQPYLRALIAAPPLT